MINTGQIDQASGQGPVTIRALHSLTRQAFEAVSDAISDVPGRWALECHHDYDGYLSILISPEGGNAGAPIYLISGTVRRVEVAQFRDDELTPLGRFINIDATVEE